MEALQRALYSKRIRRRQTGDAPLQKLLDFRFDTSEGEPQ
jgi:hypothetical protein